MASQPTQRTLKELRSLGFGAAVLERWNPHTRQRQDFVGCIDLMAWKPGVGVLLIQTTSGSNHGARWSKVCANPHIRGLMESGCRVEVWSWSKKCRDGRGTRKVWTPRRQEVLIDNLTSDVNGELAETELGADVDVNDETAAEEMALEMRSYYAKD
jgi:hypothetical protein